MSHRDPADVSPVVQAFQLVQDMVAIGGNTGWMPLRTLTRTAHGSNPSDQMEPFKLVAVVQCVFVRKPHAQAFGIDMHMESPRGELLPTRAAAPEDYPAWFLDWLMPTVRERLKEDIGSRPWRTMRLEAAPGDPPIFV